MTHTVSMGDFTGFQRGDFVFDVYRGKPGAGIICDPFAEMSTIGFKGVFSEDPARRQYGRYIVLDEEKEPFSEDLERRAEEEVVELAKLWALGVACRATNSPSDEFGAAHVADDDSCGDAWVDFFEDDDWGDWDEE